MSPLLSTLAGPTSITFTGTSNQSDSLVNKYNETQNLGASLNNGVLNNNNDLDSSLNASQSSDNRIQPGARFPSQTAPARLGMWDDEDDDNILKVLLTVHA